MAEVLGRQGGQGFSGGHEFEEEAIARGGAGYKLTTGDGGCHADTSDWGKE